VVAVDHRLVVAVSAVLLGIAGFFGATPSTAHQPEPTQTPANHAKATVVGIGDSVTAGSHCGCTDFVHLYARQLPPSEGGPATAVNLGVGGSTSADLRSDLEHPSATTEAVSRADIVLVTIGANELAPLQRTWARAGCGSDCWQDSVDGVRSNISAIVDDIHRLRHGEPTTILVTNYWNVFIDGQVARRQKELSYLRWSDRLTRAVNGAICSGARSAGARCVDLYAPFKGGHGGKDPTHLLAADGDHPNAAGHRLIARVLLAATPR
jgi:lysophospholipase L1-like esterase